jgi:DNA-binding GntR family transcriptional regulator
MRTPKSPARQTQSKARTSAASVDDSARLRRPDSVVPRPAFRESPALIAIKSHSLSDVIQQHIQELIFEGEINAGERINEKRLSEQLGVSRAPIREATRALQQLGLVDVINNRGVFVRSVNLKQVIDIFNIRVSLAELAASEAARRVNDTALVELGELIERMDSVRSPDEYLQLNLAFHQRIFELADNERLAELDEALGMELRLFRLRGLRSAGSMKVSN